MPLMTLEEAQGFLRAAVDTQGDSFVYNPSYSSMVCEYTPRTDAPIGDPRRRTGCLIGTALKLAGRSEETLKVHGFVTDLEKHFELNEVAASYFDVAQQEQDAGSTWGDAYRAAERWRSAQQLP